jgi:hypothetical protein
MFKQIIETSKVSATLSNALNNKRSKLSLQIFVKNLSRLNITVLKIRINDKNAEIKKSVDKPQKFFCVLVVYLKRFSCTLYFVTL